MDSLIAAAARAASPPRPKWPWRCASSTPRPMLAVTGLVAGGVYRGFDALAGTHRGSRCRTDGDAGPSP